MLFLGQQCKTQEFQALLCLPLQRGDDYKAVGLFEGRVRRWRKQWLTAGPTRDGQKLFFNVWRPTQERGTPCIPRNDLTPVPTPGVVKGFLSGIVAPEGVGRGLKRGRPSMSVGLERITTVTMSEGGSAGVTQKTEGAPPKIIRLKLKSSVALGSNATDKQAELPLNTPRSQIQRPGDGGAGGVSGILQGHQETGACIEVLGGQQQRTSGALLAHATVAPQQSGSVHEHFPAQRGEAPLAIAGVQSNEGPTVAPQKEEGLEAT